MAKEKFIDYSFSTENEILVEWAERVTENYKAQGYELSVRQLYYVGVSENRYPNSDRSYSALVKLITNARMAGRIDWHAIVDRNRQTIDYNYYNSLKDCLSSSSKWFKIDKWLKQPNYVEVLFEKVALQGVLQQPCGIHEVPYTAARGYPSATLMYDMAHRFKERHVKGRKSCHLIYLGDHDPSGLDIDRDVKERLNLIAGVPVHVHRIALTRPQIDQYQCPPNPAKLSDSRANDYVSQHGDSSWELDALEPATLGELVDQSIGMLKDKTLWSAEVTRERELKEQFQNIIDEVEE